MNFTITKLLGKGNRSIGVYEIILNDKIYAIKLSPYKSHLESELEISKILSSQSKLFNKCYKVLTFNFTDLIDDFPWKEKGVYSHFLKRLPITSMYYEPSEECEECEEYEGEQPKYIYGLLQDKLNLILGNFLKNNFLTREICLSFLCAMKIIYDNDIIVDDMHEDNMGIVLDKDKDIYYIVMIDFDSYEILDKDFCKDFDLAKLWNSKRIIKYMFEIYFKFGYIDFSDIVFIKNTKIFKKVFSKAIKYINVKF